MLLYFLYVVILKLYKKIRTWLYLDPVKMHINMIILFKTHYLVKCSNILLYDHNGTWIFPVTTVDISDTDLNIIGKSIMKDIIGITPYKIKRYSIEKRDDNSYDITMYSLVSTLPNGVYSKKNYQWFELNKLPKMNSKDKMTVYQVLLDID